MAMAKTMQMMMGGLFGTIVPGNTSSYWYPVGHHVAPSAFSSYHWMLMPVGGYIKDLKVTQTANPGAGKSISWYIVSSTGGQVQVDIAGGQTTGENTTTTLRVNAGDGLYSRVRRTFGFTGVPNATSAVWSFKFIPDTPNYSTLGSNGYTAELPNNATRYAPMAGSHIFYRTTKELSDIPIPAAGTIRSLYVKLVNAPSAGNSRTFRVMKNGAAQAVLCTIADTDTAGNDTANTVAVAAGDRINVRCAVTNAPVASRCTIGLVFEPDTDGEFMMAINTINDMDVAATEYAPMGGAVSNPFDAVETDVDCLAQPYENKTFVKAIYIRTEAGAGTLRAKWDFMFRINAGDTTLSKRLNDGTQSGNTVLDDPIVLADGDLLDTEIDPVAGLFGNPRARQVAISYLMQCSEVATVHILGNTTILGKTTIL